MKMIRFASLAVLVAASAFAATAVAEDKKPAPPPAVAPKPTPAPVAAPAAPAAPAAAAPTTKPAPAAAAPSKAAAPMTPPPAAAPAPTAPPMPAPAKELEAFMKGFEGSWKCETKFAAGAMGPGSPEITAKTSVKFKKEYGGHSWHGEYAVAKSKTMPAMSGVMQIAYDTGSNQLTMVGYDSLGSATLGVGPISGDSAVINEDGYMMGMKMKVRETMTKKGPKEVYHKYEIDTGKGFQVMGEDSCKK
jgi:hypothetical protein